MSAPRRRFGLERVLGRLRLAAVRRPRATLAWFALTTVIGLTLSLRLKPGASIDAFFNDGNRTAARMQRVLSEFGVMDDLLLLVSVPDTEDHPPEERAAVLREFAGRLANELHADEQVRLQVQQVTWKPAEQAIAFAEKHVVPAAPFFMSDEAFAEFMRRLTPEGMRQTLARQVRSLSAASPLGSTVSSRTLRDPLRIHELIAGEIQTNVGNSDTWNGGDELIDPTAHHLLIRIVADRPATDLDFSAKLMAGVSRAATRANTAHLQLAFTGGHAIADHNHQVIRSDMIWNIMSSVAMLQVLFLFAYRNRMAFVLAFLPVGAGIAAGFGIYALFSSDLTPAVAAIGGILAGLGIDYSIHVLSFHDGRRVRSTRQSRTFVWISAASIRDLSLAALTTIIAFVVIAFSGVAALKQFAILASFGLFVTLVASVTLLPAICVLRSDRARGHASLPPRFDVGRIAAWCVANRRKCLISFAAIVAAAMIVTALRLPGWAPFEDDFRSLHPQPNPPLETQERLASIFGPITEAWPILIEGRDADELVQRAAQAERLIREQPASLPMGVRGVLGIHRLIPNCAIVARRRADMAKLNTEQVIVDFRQAIQATPLQPDAFDEYLVYLTSLLRGASIPTLDDLSRYPDLARILLPRTPESRARQTLLWLQLERSPRTGAERDAVIHHLHLKLASMDAAPVGVTIARYEIEREVRRLLPSLGLVSIAAVFGLILLRLGNWRDALLAVAPTLFGAMLIFTAMLLMGWRFNLMNLVALPMVIGVGVDYGIFIVGSVGRDGIRRSAPLPAALSRGIHAVTLCAATTILSFGSLATSHTPAIQSLGLVLFVGVSGSWLGCFLFLIPLLTRGDRQ